MPILWPGIVGGGLAGRFNLFPNEFCALRDGDGPPALEGVPKASELRDVRVRRLGDDLALEGAIG